MKKYLSFILIIVSSINLSGQSVSISVDYPHQNADIHIHFHNPETSESFSFHHSAEHVYANGGIEVDLPPGNYFYDIDYNTHAGCNGLKIFASGSEINSKDDCGNIHLHGDLTIGVLGCQNPLATNYHPEATLDDESCIVCAPGTFGEDGVCVDCPAGTYSASSAATVCTNLSICADDEYESLAPTTTSDRVCSALSSCTAQDYESVAPTNTSDRLCTALSLCSADEYEIIAATATSNRECSVLSVCSADQYELVSATATSDRICETIIEGCTDASAYNFDSNANTDDGSCENLALPAGWSMFGYTCLESHDVIAAFEGHDGQIEIVKDEMGLSYLPAYNFNAIGNLSYGEGYQIKLKEKLEGFKFCEPVGHEDVEAAIAAVDITVDNQAAYDQGVASVTPEDGVTQADVDAAHAMYEGWCASDIDNDGICDVDEVSGCMDETACNYNSEAEFGDDSCENTSCLDACGVMNGDDSSCLDCAGVPNGTAEDLGCGCGNPAAQEGYDCEGNEIITSYQIGDLAHGGMVFYVDETGQHGLVAAMEDIEGVFEWGCYGESVNGADGQAIGTGYQNILDIVNQGCSTENGGVTAAQAALDAEINSYSDWYLPSYDELREMYNTIGKGGSDGNIGGFADLYYWSSSENNDLNAWYVFFGNGYTASFGKYGTFEVRVIRAY
jgi:hypothetical protein